MHSRALRYPLLILTARFGTWRPRVRVPSSAPFLVRKDGASPLPAERGGRRADERVRPAPAGFPLAPTGESDRGKGSRVAGAVGSRRDNRRCNANAVRRPNLQDLAADPEDRSRQTTRAIGDSSLQHGRHEPGGGHLRQPTRAREPLQTLKSIGSARRLRARRARKKSGRRP